MVNRWRVSKPTIIEWGINVSMIFLNSLISSWTKGRLMISNMICSSVINRLMIENKSLTNSKLNR